MQVVSVLPADGHAVAIVMYLDNQSRIGAMTKTAGRVMGEMRPNGGGREGSGTWGQAGSLVFGGGQRSQPRYGRGELASLLRAVMTTYSPCIRLSSQVKEVLCEGLLFISSHREGLDYTDSDSELCFSFFVLVVPERFLVLISRSFKFSDGRCWSFSSL